MVTFVNFLKMTPKFFNKLLLLTALVSLLHAAFSAAQYRTYLRITEQETSQLPLDIILQALISLIMVIYNIIQVMGDFREIRAAVELQEKTWETFSNIPAFYRFNHRGKALSPFYKPPPVGGKADLSSAD